MRCDICDEEVDNSEDLAKHMEKMHAMGETDEPKQEEASPLPAEEDEPGPGPNPRPDLPRS